MSSPIPTHSSPKVLKKMEKELLKEGKAEESSLKHAIKDLSSTEKSKGKAAKAAEKATKMLSKSEKKEMKTAQKVNKITHQHDVALADVQSKERDLKIKQDHDGKLEQELEAKRSRVEAAIKNQEAHNREREEKLGKIRAELVGGPKAAAAAADARASES